MKVNLQKIFVPIVVLNICLSLLGISAFAYTGVSDYVYTTEKEVYLDAVNLIEAYSNGEISFEDFASDLTYVQGKAYTAGLDIAAVKIQQFIDVCNLKFGADSSFGGSEHGGGGVSGSRTPITDIWNDICVKNNVPIDTVQNSSTDLGGHGALCIYKNSSTRYLYYFYCEYIVLPNENPINAKAFGDYEKIMYKEYNLNKYYDTLTGNNDTPKSFCYSPKNFDFHFYGDVRYEDGTQAPTDDEFEYGTIRKFDEMDDSEIVDLLKDISEKLEQEYPDLTSIEGLLRAIYARLGTLDSDDDNELLASILSALQALNNGDNEAYFKNLKDIYNDTFSEHYKEVKKDLTIDENSQSDHYNSLKTLLLKKFSFIDNMKNFVTYCFEQYSKTSENPELQIEYNNNSYSINFSYFNDVMPTVRIMLAVFIYLTYAYHTYRKIPSYINGGDNE